VAGGSLLLEELHDRLKLRLLAWCGARGWDYYNDVIVTSDGLTATSLPKSVSSPTSLLMWPEVQKLGHTISRSRGSLLRRSRVEHNYKARKRDGRGPLLGIADAIEGGVEGRIATSHFVQRDGTVVRETLWTVVEVHYERHRHAARRVVVSRTRVGPTHSPKE